MAYLTETELRKRYDEAEIDDLVGSLTQSDATAKINAALSEAEGLVNSYLASKYSVPVDASSTVKRLVADIARYYLYDDVASDEVRTRYDDAMKFLASVANGRAQLAVASSDTGSQPESHGSSSHVSGSGSTLDLSGY